MSTATETFVTGDLVTAAYLELLGIEAEIRHAPERSERSVDFVYEDGASIQPLLLDLRAGRARVEPRAFHAMLVEIRRRIPEYLRELRGGGK